jgi:predicted cobalt transporter CbtA
MDVMGRAPGAPPPLELAGDPAIERLARTIRWLTTVALAALVVATIVLR